MRQGSASLQLVLSLLGALALFAGALTFAAIGALQIFLPQPELDPAPAFLWAGSLAFAGLLVLPSAYYALQSARGRLAEGHTNPTWVTGLALVLLLVVLPIILLLGNVIASNPHIAWVLLPPLHVLAVSIPIFWMGSMALRQLPVGSPRRFWGIFAAAITIGPLSILIIELFAMILAAGAALLAISSIPGMTEQLTELFQSLQYGIPNERSLAPLLEPLTSSPAPVLAVVSFVAVIVPLIEETLKPAGLWLLARRSLTPTEGFALGALSGAGYALFESLFLSASGQAWSVVVIARIGTAALHILTTALTGWGLALAWGQKKYARLGLQFGVAVLLHAAWNALTALNAAAALLPPDTNNLVITIGKLAPGGLMALFLGCFITLSMLNRRMAASAQIPVPAAAPAGDSNPIPSSVEVETTNGTDPKPD